MYIHVESLSSQHKFYCLLLFGVNPLSNLTEEFTTARNFCCHKTSLLINTIIQHFVIFVGKGLKNTIRDGSALLLNTYDLHGRVIFRPEVSGLSHSVVLFFAPQKFSMGCLFLRKQTSGPSHPENTKNMFLTYFASR